MPQPPVVTDHPQVQLLKWTFRPVEFLEACAQRYGDCFTIQVGASSPSLTVFSHPDAVAEIFAANASLDSGKAQVILQLVLGGFSLLLLDGKPHKRHRQLIVPALHGDRIRAYGEIICQITEQEIAKWQSGDRVVMLPTLSEITFRVILKTVFAFQGSNRDQLLSKRIRSFLDRFTSPLLYLIPFLPLLQKDWGTWSPQRQFVRQMSELRELLLAEIRYRHAHLDPDAIDVLTMLLMAKDEAGESLTDEELLDEVLTLLFAGHDSSAVVFSWVFYFIQAHPEVEAQLRAELESLGSDPDPAEIVKLPYLDAVCNESLRLRSAVPASSPRITTQPLTIQNYELPPDTMLVPAQHLTHHHPERFPQPRQFNPDRFLNHRYSASEFYPFGGGSRRCIGAVFASYEMRLIVATVLRRYRLGLTMPQMPRTIRRGVNIAPKGGVKMQILQRLERSRRPSVPLLS